MAFLHALQDEISVRLKLGAHLPREDLLGAISAFKLVGVGKELEALTKEFLQEIGASLETDLMAAVKTSKARVDFRTFTGNASKPAASWQHFPCSGRKCE